MTLDVRTPGYSLRDVLSGAPVITDQVDGACRSLDITVQRTDAHINRLGQVIELYYDSKRWFYGRIVKRGFNSQGEVTYKAFDPLYYLHKNEDDFLVKNQTATQYLKILASKYNIPVASLANTGVVFKALYYQGAPADKVAIDLLARTGKANGKKYWYRFNPYSDDFGLKMFERKVPATVWSFQVGVNLTAANYEDSIEDMYNAVKLVNRENGKVVTKVNSAHKTSYGTMQKFAEVDKDADKTMTGQAADLLKELSQVSVSMDFNGINPDRTMPQLFSGDYVYVQEEYTGMYGAYNLLDVTHTFTSDNLVEIGATVKRTPDMLAIVYDDATEKPDYLKTKAELDAEKKKEEAARKKREKTKTPAKK